jgi:prevent-host-death family protein
MKKIIPAGKFKAECLSIIDEVQKTKLPVIITKRNKPIAQLIPFETEKGLFGKMKGTGRIKGDIVQPVGEKWDADLTFTL